MRMRVSMLVQIVGDSVVDLVDIFVDQVDVVGLDVDKFFRQSGSSFRHLELENIVFGKETRQMLDMLDALKGTRA